MLLGIAANSPANAQQTPAAGKRVHRAKLEVKGEKDQYKLDTDMEATVASLNEKVVSPS